MKLAFLMAGHLRMFDQDTIDSLKKFMEGYDYDLFVTTHDTLDRSEQKHYYGHDMKLSTSDVRGMFEGLPLKWLQITSDQDYSSRQCIKCRSGLPKWVSPDTKVNHDMGLCSTHCDKCKLPNMIEIGPVSYCWRMWRNVSDCYDMAHDYANIHNIKYDYFIRGRPDILYMERIDFSKLPPLTHNIVIGFGTNLGFPNDTFAIANNPAFEHYCSIENVVKNSYYSHDIVADVINKYPIYKFFDLAWKRRNLDPVSNTWTKKEIQYFPKRQYISDMNLLEFE